MKFQTPCIFVESITWHIDTRPTNTVEIFGRNVLRNVVKQTDRKKPAVDNLLALSLIKIKIKKTAEQVMQVHETET